MLKNKKRIVTVLMIGSLLFAVSGCGNQIPEMTEQQNALVTEYAAGLLLKYHADYNGRLVDTAVAPGEETVPMETIPTETMPEEMVSDNSVSGDAQEMVSAENDTIGDESVEEAEKPALAMSQVLGIDGFDVQYRSFEVCDAYPNTEVSPEELFFAMKAGAGNKLLVLKIDITNISAQEALFNTLEKVDLDCKVIINDGDKKSAYVSMLDNDFMAMNHMIAAGETKEAAIITELPEDEAQQITNVKLQIKNEGQSTTVSATE